MTKEMTSEEIVTKLLTSNEIIKPKRGNFYISNPSIDTLGDIIPLSALKTKPLETQSPESLKYKFITL